MKEILARMERDWDARAREAPEYYVATGRREWSMEEFFRGGEINVDNDILSDREIICRGKEPKDMRVLEIGCGAGRMTRAIAASFGAVHAVDVSAEMISLAKRNLAGLPNVTLFKNNGADLSELPGRSYDFAFSFIVFQHIPTREIIDTYVREVYRCLKPGAIFKFQVQGAADIRSSCDDTWVGISMSLADAQSLAERNRFELLRASGENSQYFWLWFLKPKAPWIPRSIRRPWREALARVRSAFEGKMEVAFSTQHVRAGGAYSVRVPMFAGQTIDIEYELEPVTPGPRATGVVSKWCELDAQGEAQIQVPAEHPSGVVRINKVRSRTAGSRWYRASAAIHVTNLAS